MDSALVLKNPVLKIMNEEIESVIGKISKTYNIPIGDLRKCYNHTCLTIKYGIKKRVKRKIETQNQCMGRKIDMEQCTRSRKEGSEYCLSHQKSLKFGRIDDNMENKPLKKKNRKKKDDYIETKKIKLGDEFYLLDNNNNIYTFNVTQPKYLGLYNHDNQQIINNI